MYHFDVSVSKNVWKWFVFYWDETITYSENKTGNGCRNKKTFWNLSCKLSHKNWEK